MNDEELRAFLDSATVGESSSPKQSAREETATSDPAAAAPPVGAPITPATEATTKRNSGISFEDLIGSRRNPAPTESAAPPVASPEPDLVPLVLPGPKADSPASQSVTPLHLPEPTRPYQVDAARPAAAAPATQPIASADTADFPPTEPLARVDLPAAAVPQQPVTPAVPVSAPVTAAAIAPDLFGNASSASQGDYEAISVTGGEPTVKRWLPWAIVGGGAAIALIASFLVVNAVTGGDSEDSTASTTNTSQISEPAEPSSPKPSQPTTSLDEDDSVDDKDEIDPTKPPVVEVGPTMSLPISQWAVTAQLSSRFGQSFYNINASDQLVLNSSLIDSLPESCAAMRQEWGIQRVEGTKFEVLKPVTRCAEAPELYDELWGLTAAMVASITPE